MGEVSIGVNDLGLGQGHSFVSVDYEDYGVDIELHGAPLGGAVSGGGRAIFHDDVPINVETRDPVPNHHNEITIASDVPDDVLEDVMDKVLADTQKQFSQAEYQAPGLGRVPVSIVGRSVASIELGDACNSTCQNSNTVARYAAELTIEELRARGYDVSDLPSHDELADGLNLPGWHANADDLDSISDPGIDDYNSGPTPGSPGAESGGSDGPEGSNQNGGDGPNTGGEAPDPEAPDEGTANHSPGGAGSGDVGSTDHVGGSDGSNNEDEITGGSYPNNDPEADNPGSSGTSSPSNPNGNPTGSDPTMGGYEPDDPRNGAPVILDLDGDGVEISFGEAIYFDWDEDGYKEQTSWAAEDDGFLVLDLNADGSRGAGDGKIDQARELAFALWGNEGDTDLQALARAFDDNNDGKLNASDAVWGELKIWQDLDQDGVTDAGELKSLGDWGISEINLTYDDGSAFSDTDDDITVFGNTLHGLASYTMNGTVRAGGGVVNIVSYQRLAMVRNSRGRKSQSQGIHSSPVECRRIMRCACPENTTRPNRGFRGRAAQSGQRGDAVNLCRTVA